MWRALFIVRLPPRLSRTLTLFEDQTGIGAVPLKWANASFDLKRAAPAVLAEDRGGADHPASGDLQ
jgi:hypothetical protein